MDVTQPSSRHPDVSAVDDDRALISLASAFALAQLALHLWGTLSTRDLQTRLMHAIALFYDLFLLAIAVVALRSLLRRCGDRWRPAAGIASKIVLFAIGLTLASYPLLLPEFLGFPINVFSVDFGVTGFFVTNILGSRGMLAMAAVAVLGAVSLRWPIRLPLPRRKLLYWLLVTLGLMGIVLSLARWSFMATHPHLHLRIPTVCAGPHRLDGNRAWPRPAQQGGLGIIGSESRRGGHGG